MKLIKTIRLHRNFRKRQEYLFFKTCQWSQIFTKLSNLGYKNPYLNEYSAINKAVNKLNNKLPWVYFFLSDILGFSKSLKYIPIKDVSIDLDLDLITFDIVASPGFKESKLR